MHNSHLIIVLRTFSKKELRELQKWLESPIHNQRDDVLSLLHYLTSSDTLDREKQLRKEKIYEKIFPKEVFDDAKLRQTMHFLLRCVEEFLIYNELQQDVVHTQLTLAGIYRKRKLDKTFKKSRGKSLIVIIIICVMNTCYSRKIIFFWRVKSVLLK